MFLVSLAMFVLALAAFLVGLLAGLALFFISCFMDMGPKLFALVLRENDVQMSHSLVRPWAISLFYFCSEADRSR